MDRSPRTPQLRIAPWAIIAVLGTCPLRSSAQSVLQTKSALAKQGVTPSITYDGDVASNLSGGLKRDTTYLGNVRLQLSLDGEKLLSRPGMTACYGYAPGTCREISLGMPSTSAIFGMRPCQHEQCQIKSG